MENDFQLDARRVLRCDKPIEFCFVKVCLLIAQSPVLGTTKLLK